MTMENISQAWPMILSIIFFISWCIRLEVNQRFQREAIRELKDDARKKDEAIWKKMDSFQESLNKVLVSLAKIEGKLEVHDK